MTKERFEEEQKKGYMPNKTYDEYLESVNKLYDEIDEEEGSEEA